jgi:hypothetical protein
MCVSRLSLSSCAASVGGKKKIQIFDEIHLKVLRSVTLRAHYSAAFGQSVKDMKTQIPFFKECKCGCAAGLTAITGSHTLGHAHSRRVSSDCEELIPGSTEKSRNMVRDDVIKSKTPPFSLSLPLSM